jgi:hypothetical protein
VANILNKERARTEIASKLTAHWLNRATSFGFERVPPARPHKPLHDDIVVRADPEYPILWSPSGDREIVCSVNGNAFVIAAHPQILRVIRRLNSGEVCRVRELIGEGNDDSAIAEGIRSFLEKLHALRGISEICRSRR